MLHPNLINNCARSVLLHAADPKLPQYNICTFSSLSASLLSEILERWDRMAVHCALPHTTASPVWMLLGSVSLLNFTANTLVSAWRVRRPLLLSGLAASWKHGEGRALADIALYFLTSFDLDSLFLESPQSFTDILEFVLDDSLWRTWWGRRGLHWRK